MGNGSSHHDYESITAQKMNAQQQKVEELMRQAVLRAGANHESEIRFACKSLLVIPTEIGLCKSLTELWLFSNKLSLVPTEVGLLTSLTTLSLSYNKLSLVPTEVGLLTALTTLSLGGNVLSLVPTEVGLLTSLTKLYLNDNSLSLVPTEIGLCNSLTLLHLDHNKFSSVPTQLGLLTSLVDLRLNDNSLSLVPTEVGLLTSLTALHLNHNSLSSIPTELGLLTALTELHLDASMCEKYSHVNGSKPTVNFFILLQHKLQTTTTTATTTTTPTKPTPTTPAPTTPTPTTPTPTPTTTPTTPTPTPTKPTPTPTTPTPTPPTTPTTPTPTKTTMTTTTESSSLNQRLEDIDTNPKLLSPISGWQHTKLTTFLEACKSLPPLRDIMMHGKAALYAGKQFCFKHPDFAQGLSDDLRHGFAAAIHLYTQEWEDPLYRALNDNLRNENRELLKPWFAFLKFLLLGLKLLPLYEGGKTVTLYRGVKLDLSSIYVKGFPFTWWGFTSTTTSLETLQSEAFVGKAGDRTIFNIRTSSGVSIDTLSAVRTEAEVLLHCGANFVVESCFCASSQPGSSLYIIQLREEQEEDEWGEYEAVGDELMIEVLRRVKENKKSVAI